LSGFRKLTEREVHRGRRITVAVATFEAPDGSEFDRDVVHHPGAVSVVPVTDGGSDVLLVRQFRAAVGKELLEIPAGLRDVEGEPPEETARRELAEEVGMWPGRLEPLAEFYNSAGFSDEYSYVYLALDLSPAAREAHSIEERHMTVERVALDDVPGMIRRAEIVDAKTIIGLALALDALDG
jgi:ADP-ribose diphosphatase